MAGSTTSPWLLPAWTRLALALLPTAAVGVCLVNGALAGGKFYDPRDPLLLYMIGGFVAGALFLKGLAPASGSRPADPVLIAVCLLAPLSLLYPWLVIRGLLGPEIGGFELLWKYKKARPDWGDHNSRVLLAIAGSFLSVGIPVLFGILCLTSESPRPILRWFLLALEGVVYAPFFFKLDGPMCLAYFHDGGPDWLRLKFQTLPDTVTFGPLMRQAAVLAMFALCLQGTRTAGDRETPGRKKRKKSAG